MSAPGRSLLGFMEPQHAINYLQGVCRVNDPSPDALMATFNAARTRLGVRPTPRAGHPEMVDIPAGHEQHLQAVAGHPRLQMGLDGQGGSFQLVEIDQILAYQFHIDVSRTRALCAALGSPPTVASMLPVLLPTQLEPIPFQTVPHPNGLVLRSRSANFRTLAQGQVGMDQVQDLVYFGVGVGASAPWVHVARYDGRIYLRNGYHRVYGARLAGATHVPCIVVDAPTWEWVGAAGQGRTFDRVLLDGPNPPTMRHYSPRRAWRVALREVTRLVQVTWREFFLPEDGL